MVDSVSGAGGPQNLSQVNRTQSSRDVDERHGERRSEGANEAPPTDEVQISQEAQDLARAQAEQEAQQTAEQTRTILEELTDETLSSDGRRVDTLL